MKLVGRRGLFSIPGRSIYAASAILRVLLFRIRVALFEQRFTNEKLVDLVLASRDIGPIQLRSELIAMLDAVRRQKPKTVLEIGTAHGGTLFLLCLASDKNGTILSIDLPGGEFGGGYPVWKTPLYRAFGRIGQRIHLLRANSHAQETSLKIQAILAGQTVDFLFIDADHTYEGVRRDFELYAPLVTPGGMIGFHDIAPRPPSADYGVRRFWEELKSQYSCTEIINDPNQIGYGIGLIQK